MTDLSSIIELVEKATGPSDELDANIRCALLVKDTAAYVAQSTHNGAWLIYSGEYNGRPRLYENRDRSISHEVWRGGYTASIDAAVALAERVMPGCRMELTTTGFKPGASLVTEFGIAGAYAATLPLAILLATLRALQSKGGEA